MIVLIFLKTKCSLQFWSANNNNNNFYYYYIHISVCTKTFLSFQFAVLKNKTSARKLIAASYMQLQCNFEIQIIQSMVPCWNYLNFKITLKLHIWSSCTLSNSSADAFANEILLNQLGSFHWGSSPLPWHLMNEAGKAFV